MSYYTSLVAEMVASMAERWVAVMGAPWVVAMDALSAAHWAES